LLEKNALLEKEEDIPKLRLPVNPLNIKYIIVRGEEDVVRIIRALEDTYGDQNYSQNTMKKLVTNIVTVKQMLEDF